MDSSYVIEISGSLSKFTKLGVDRYQFRCPFCGDSVKDPNKARGNLKRSIRHRDHLSFICFNCGKQCLFPTLLKECFPDVYKRYLIEKFMGNRKEDEIDWDEKDLKAAKPVFKKKLKPEDHFESLLGLHWTHPAIIYCQNRQIPQEAFKELWWASEFWSTTASLGSESRRPETDEGRIIIPLIDPELGMVGVQGRSISPYSKKLRYATAQFVPGSRMMFGFHRISTTAELIVLEGPFDTFFVNNSVALCGAQNPDNRGLENAIWYLDQEPRNQHIVNTIGKLAKAGKRIVLLPEEYQEKDPNELHITMELSNDEITDLAKKHSFSGIEAMLRLASWKRCK